MRVWIHNLHSHGVSPLLIFILKYENGFEAINEPGNVLACCQRRPPNGHRPTPADRFSSLKGGQQAALKAQPRHHRFADEKRILEQAAHGGRRNQKGSCVLPGQGLDLASGRASSTIGISWSSGARASLLESKSSAPPRGRARIGWSPGRATQPQGS